MMSQRMQADWRWIAVRAVAAFIFGLLALLLPGITLGALVILFGAFALVDGVFTLVAAFTRGRGGWNTVAWLLAGALGVGVGIVTFFWPGITALALLYVIAAWALVTGAFEIAAAISLRREINHEWLLVLSGDGDVQRAPLSDFVRERCKIGEVFFRNTGPKRRDVLAYVCE